VIGEGRPHSLSKHMGCLYQGFAYFKVHLFFHFKNTFENFENFYIYFKLIF
jgi:hypothetical protein